MSEDLKARRAAVDEALHDAQVKREEEKELAALIVDEARAKCLAEGLTEGKDFRVVSAVGEPPIVLKLPATGRMVMLKRFRAPIDDTKNGKITLENSMQFVTPCVASPERSEFLAICERVPGLIYDLSNELHAMLRGAQEEERGK